MAPKKSTAKRKAAAATVAAAVITANPATSNSAVETTAAGAADSIPAIEDLVTQSSSQAAAGAAAALPAGQMLVGTINRCVMKCRAGTTSAPGRICPAVFPPCSYPYRVHLEAGRWYRYCTCGRSGNPPYCDDTHNARTDPQPLEFKISVEQDWMLLCGCKLTATPPFCDASHIRAPEECFPEEFGLSLEAGTASAAFSSAVAVPFVAASSLGSFSTFTASTVASVADESTAAAATTSQPHANSSAAAGVAVSGITLPASAYSAGSLGSLSSFTATPLPATAAVASTDAALDPAADTEPVQKRIKRDAPPPAATAAVAPATPLPRSAAVTRWCTIS